MQTYVNGSIPHTDRLPDATIVVMGPTGTGKSSFIKLITQDENIRVGHGQESTTDRICLAYHVKPDRRIIFVDTPGFDDSREDITDAAILKQIAGFLDTEFNQERKLTGVIYMHRISDNKMGGISRRNMKMFQSICGTDSLKNVFIVTTMWNSVEEEVGASRERELRDKIFKPFRDNGAHLVRLSGGNPLDSAHDIVAHLLQNDPVALLIQQELGAGKSVVNTAAGSQLNTHLEHLVERQNQEIKQLQQEMVATKKVDQERKYLLEEQQKLMGERTRWQSNIQKLKEDLEAERVRATKMTQALETAFEKAGNQLEWRLRMEQQAAEQERQRERERERERMLDVMKLGLSVVCHLAGASGGLI